MAALTRACGGLLIWAVVFSLMYGAHGLGCERGWVGVPVAGTSLHLIVLGALWIAGLIALAGYGVAPRLTRSTEEKPTLIDRLTTGLAAVGFISLIFTGGPILLYPACV